MTVSTASPSLSTADREIVTTRVFDAPRSRVFAAWTDPRHLEKWWGPDGFTNTFEVCDVQPGGAWRFVMHGPNGIDYPNESRFVEVSEPERILIDHVSAPQFQVTATFAEQPADRTKLTFRMLFTTAAECDRIKGICIPSNEQNMDRLAALLAATA